MLLILFLSASIYFFRKTIFKFFKKTKYRKQYILFFIFALAIFLRIYRVDTLPLGFFSDEASIGYNAYCIVETGMDEHGVPMPVYFKAFGEYKNPVLIYVSAILVKILGPTVLAVRLASALLGILAVFLCYAVSRLYFDFRVSALATFLLAVSPWHVVFSRHVGDASSLTPFLLLSFYLLTKGFKKNPMYLIVAALPVAITMYCYAIAKLFMPLFVLTMFILNWKKVWTYKKEVAIFSCAVILFLIPMIVYTFTRPIQGRFEMLSIANEDYSLRPERYKFNKMNLGFLTHKKEIFIPAIFIKNYFLNISPEFYLFKGDSNIRHNVGNRGELLVFTYFLFMFAMIYILARKKKQFYIFLGWFLIYPIGLSMTSNLYHAPRAICGLPLFQMLAAYGFFEIYKYIKINRNKYNLKKLISTIFLIFIYIIGIIDMGNFLKVYFMDYQKRSMDSFDLNSYIVYKQVAKISDQYENIIVPFTVDYVIALFHEKVKPGLYLNKNYRLKYKERKNFFDENLSQKNLRIQRPLQGEVGNVILNLKDPFGNLAYQAVELPMIAPSGNPEIDSRRGLHGYYYQGENFEEFKYATLDKYLSFHWGMEGPTNGQHRLGLDEFSVRWDGYVYAAVDGPYTFYTTSDDGVKLKIDDEMLIEDWLDHPPVKHVGRKFLTKGWHRIGIHYFDHGGEALLEVKMEKPSGEIQTLDASVLSTDHSI